MTRADMKRELLAEVATRTGVQLDPDALIIGFARRAAAYKRADLILGDDERAAPLFDRRRPDRLSRARRTPRITTGKAP